MIALRLRTLVHLVGYAERGGCERCAEVFIRHSPEFNHVVLVLGQAGPMSPVWAGQGAAVVHLDVLARHWLNFRAGVTAALQDRDFDGVIVWAGIRVPWVLAALAPYDRPVVLHAGNPFTGAVRTRLQLQLGGLLPRPRQVTVVGCSAHVAESFRRAPFYRGLNVVACLNPVETPATNPHQARPLGSADRIRIGMVARLDPIKDHRTLLQAFRELRGRWPKAELHLAGDGQLRAALHAQARRLGLGSAVTFHGAIADVPAFLRSLDLFAYFTTPQEGMGVALAEALAQGLPCVVSDLPVMREVSGDGADCGVSLTAAEPPAAARVMDALLRDEQERRALSGRAFARARGAFDPRLAAERYLSLLEEPC